VYVFVNESAGVCLPLPPSLPLSPSLSFSPSLSLNLHLSLNVRVLYNTHQLHGPELVDECHVPRHHLLQCELKVLELLDSECFLLVVLIVVKVISQLLQVTKLHTRHVGERWERLFLLLLFFFFFSLCVCARVSLLHPLSLSSSSSTCWRRRLSWLSTFSWSCWVSTFPREAAILRREESSYTGKESQK
jgi:hypothetical protein